MDPNHLVKYELTYELLIRGYTGDMPSVACQRYLLRRLMKEEISITKEAENFLVGKDDKEILESLKIAESLIDKYPGKDAKQHEKRIRSKILHISSRVNRIVGNSEVSEDSNEKFKVEAQSKLKWLEERLKKRVESMYKAMSSSFVNNPGSHEFEGESGEDYASNTDDERCSSDEDNEEYIRSASPIIGKSKRVSRLSVPIYKWNVKFNGESNLIEFLERVEELKEARGATEEDLFKGTVDLFEGQTLSWIRSQKNKIKSWKQLVAALKEIYIPEEYDDGVWDQIKARKQKQIEKVEIYVAQMQHLFDRLTVHPGEDVFLRYVRKNMLPEYRTQLALTTIRNVDHLTSLCRKIKAAQPSNFSRPGNSQQCSVQFEVATNEQEIKREQKPFQNSTAGNRINQAEGSARRIQGLCWNCNKSGHAFRDCRTPRKEVFCYNCGLKGKIKSNCPNCSKN